MHSQTNEQALEAAIEKILTGTCLEEIKSQGLSVGAVNEDAEMYQAGKGYFIGQPNNFNVQFAIDEQFFWTFLETTQKEELDKLRTLSTSAGSAESGAEVSDWKLKILNRFDRMIKKYGILHLLRKGLEVDDAHFTLFYQLPLTSSSKSVKDRFEQNMFSITRQLRYSKDNPREEIDLVLFLNGLPLVTMELKNSWTGQTAKVHGQQQYKTQRDNKQPLLNFARCIVHFAVDTDEAYMTTKLSGKDTFFLPFNKGNKFGKGNPELPNGSVGHRTQYLWDEVFTRDSLANIIQHFVRLDGKKKDPLQGKTLFFPRYHQMDVVRKIINHASENGVDQTYLIQHSAGSGKSNSITWAAYQLIEAYPANKTVAGDRGMEKPIFDSVIVVTDRRLLDKQIRDNIADFSEVKNIVAPAYSSKELKESLEQGKKIIISTIQKFPFIIDGIADLSEKRFAVIIDEAHSSQSGSAHDSMNTAMGKQAAEESDGTEGQDKVVAAMHARKMKGNASYLAFTATPKPITFEKFGIPNESGGFDPFHLYSMKQAIQEGFILDVLANYTTLKSYYEIEKSIEDNPEFDSVKAQKKLRAFVEQHEETIGTKAEIILDHFIPKIVNTKKLKGKAKAMVVTQSISSAIHYYKALRNVLESKGNPFKIAIAFSGEKMVDGIEYTEAGLNGFAEKETAAKFNTDDYRILVVANKYLTGFDQPKLCAMYVDKKLQGVLAVQALSRLNRAADKLGKRSEDVFVLDFFNTTDDIKEAFDPFYTGTSLSKATDVNVLHELKANLDDVGVYEWAEVEDFVYKYFEKVDAQVLSPIIERAAERFIHELELEDDEKADFKIKAKQFVKIYGQMAAILPFEKLSWEKLFWFLKFLIPKLPVKPDKIDGIDELLEHVDLSTYGLERTKLNQPIVLDDAETELDPQNPNPRGAHGSEDEEDPLDLIIKSFNERWFHGWDATPEDQRVKFIQVSKKLIAHPDFEEKYANNPDAQNRELALHKMIDEVLSRQRKQEIELYKLHAKDDTFKQAFFDTMKRMVDKSA
ncbi:MAG: DEAD/DEAH box helicase family protein [Putridiphycobacter sp.]|nr:DEAD/DEAH box helicase family protein [Putridiphycobacter sp.]